MVAVKGTLKFRLTGGAANANPFASFGGVMSSVDAPTLIMPNVTWQESISGIVDYACITMFNTNTNPIDIAANFWLYIQQQMTGMDTLNIQLDPAGVGDGVTTGVATTIADRFTAPAGVTFPAQPPVGENAHLLLNGSEFNLNNGEGIGLWLRRTVPPGATSEPVDLGRIGFIWGA